MEATRVGSFDDEMYFDFKEWFDNEVESLKDDPEYIRIGKELEKQINENNTPSI